jgi:hypothetical protein
MARWNIKNLLQNLWQGLVSPIIVAELSLKDYQNKKYLTKELETCDCCHDEVSWRDARYTGVQFLCNKCNKELK